MLALLERHGVAAFDRKTFDPGHFTASGFVMSPDGGSVLLIRHAKLKRWLQPGGHIDAGDVSPIHAARREVLEETNVTADGEDRLLDLDIHPIPANAAKREPAHEHFDLRFLMRAARTHLAAGDDALAARWVPLAEVAVTVSDPSVRRVIERLGRD
jgi:8-oxo-dGTP pyrophosphatase MutT (NUDIX family)